MNGLVLGVLGAGRLANTTQRSIYVPRRADVREAADGVGVLSSDVDAGLAPL
ncbi:hypothetical protein [Catelliglobosispora koreensis]|uniref:hypothetical protein n=1 Tax=Catelliglobosispora koreensis TaxID=129052 RepID=UPI0003728440|nr:hypothetical protein [Catelliglobosispora koreensis]